MSGCILVAVDGGSSIAAITAALDLARRDDARLRAIGLCGDVPIGMVRASAPDGASLHRRTEIAAALDAASARARELDVPFGAVVRGGSPERVLLEEAVRCHADRVVVEAAGSRGPRWRRRRALERAGREVPCGIVATGTGAEGRRSAAHASVA